MLAELNFTSVDIEFSQIVHSLFYVHGYYHGEVQGMLVGDTTYNRVISDQPFYVFVTQPRIIPVHSWLREKLWI